NIDNLGGALEMTMHLLRLGHRNIRMISGPARNRDSAEREKGFRLALHRAGIAVGSDVIVQGDFTEASGYRCTATLLTSSARPTAIFAANDSMAVGALSALRKAGLRVPEDVAVVGFDDIPIAEYVNPALTTVRVAIAELGAIAATRLFECIRAHNHHERKHEVQPTELVIRGSCGALTMYSPNQQEALT
ncbi:MAG TPA: substrate-binding domain-containing protein, partial [Longimicrobiales bacterium]